MGWAPGATGEQVLSSVARDAIELFGTALSARLRECQNPACALLFVDHSRPGKRAWCTMRRCGNLSKVARYRAAHSPPPPVRPKPASRLSLDVARLR